MAFTFTFWTHSVFCCHVNNLPSFSVKEKQIDSYFGTFKGFEKIGSLGTNQLSCTNGVPIRLTFL